MTSPGIQIRPLVMTSGEEVQNQVFFDEVRVPKTNVLGKIDDGWTVAKYLLEFERGGGASSPALQVMAEEISTAAADMPGPDGGRLIDDPAFARKLADARIRTEVLEILEYRVLAAVAEGSNPGTASSMLKVVATELSQTLTELAMEAAGPARPRVSAARDPPRRPGHRIRAAAGRVRQRRAVAGGRAAALLQRPRRLDLRRQQRDSAKHPRQSGIGAVDGLQPEQGTRTAPRRADKFLSTRYDLEKSRAAAKTGAGWQPDIWRAFADELGILGAALPEDVGGIGGGPVELMVITEALGHALVVEPYVDTVVVAGGLLRRAGGEQAACAAGEGRGRYRGRGAGRRRGRRPATAGRTSRPPPSATDDGWVLNGSQDRRDERAACHPPADHRADTGGLSLFLVETRLGVQAD